MMGAWECCSAMLAAMAVWMWLNRNAFWRDLPIARLLVRCLVWCQVALRGVHEGGVGAGWSEERVDDSTSRLPPSAPTRSWLRCGHPCAEDPRWCGRSRNCAEHLSRCLN